MTRTTIRSRGGGEFACHLVTPQAHGRVPAVVLASTVHGVNDDIRAIADELAAHGFIAAVPDLFWRSVAGQRDASSRLEQVARGEADMADTLAHLQALPMFNGRAVVAGFCYGGPYAILGPKRLGFDAGISCHGTRMEAYLHELDGLDAAVCVIWGDDDHLAPAEVLDAYRKTSARMSNLEVHVLPGVRHGFTMRSARAFDPVARDFSLSRITAIVEGPRRAPSA